MNRTYTCSYCKKEITDVFIFKSHILNCKTNFFKNINNHNKKNIKKIIKKKYNKITNKKIQFEDILINSKSNLKLLIIDKNYFSNIKLEIKKQKFKFKKQPKIIQKDYEINSINNYVNNKKIILVGNYNINNKFNEIQNNDIIVRIHKIPIKKEYIDIGERTDILYDYAYNFITRNNIKYFCSIKSYENDKININKIKNNKTNIHIISNIMWKELNKKLHNVSKEVIIIFDLISNNIKSLELIGFNFNLLKIKEKNFLANLLLMNNNTIVDNNINKILYLKYYNFINFFKQDIFKIKHIHLLNLNTNNNNIMFAFKNIEYNNFNGIIIRFDNFFYKRKTDILIVTQQKNINKQFSFIINMINKYNGINNGYLDDVFINNIINQIRILNINNISYKMLVLLYFVLLFRNNLYIDEIKFENIYEDLLFKFFIKNNFIRYF